MNRQEWYAFEHQERFERWVEAETRRAYRERKLRKRTLKRAHQTWLVRQALKPVHASNRAAYERAIRMAGIFG